METEQYKTVLGSIFSGLPAGEYEALHGEEDDFFGAIRRKHMPTLPPTPALQSPAAIKGFLAESWKVIAHNKGSFGSKEGKAAYGRLFKLKIREESQQQIADAINAGPLPTMPGANNFYRLCQELQIAVARRTGQRPILARAGSLLAVGLQAAANLAASAPQAQATAKQLAEDAHQAAQAVVALPGTITETVKELPDHLAEKANEVAQTAIASASAEAQEVIPQVVAESSESVLDRVMADPKKLAVGGAIGLGALAALALIFRKK